MKTQKKFVKAKYDFVFKELMRNETVRQYFVADVLGIPAEQVRTTRLLNTFLWQQYRSQKLGILDVLVELENGTRVDIEIQVRRVRHWDRRAVFYLSKLYADNLRRGEDFAGARRTITINLLDFNLNDDEKYHRVYRLRSEDGEELTDIVELHVIELCKKLSGQDAVDDWIRLLNACTEEELTMIGTKNAGILEAVKELRTMSFGRSLRAWCESRLKYERDRRGELDYARDEGNGQGQRLMMELYRRLKEENRLADYDRAVEDEAYRKRLLQEFGL